MATDRRAEVIAWKHRILERYLESEQLGTYEPDDERNVFYVPHQVVVPASSRQALAKAESLAASYGRPTFGLAGVVGLQAAAGLSSHVQVSDGMAIDLDPAKVRDTVGFAAEHAAAGMTLNHLVTGLQRRTGYPDGDPEYAEGPLPRFPAQPPHQGRGVTVAVIDTGFPTPARVRDELEQTWFAYDCDYSTQPGEVDDEGRPQRHIDDVDEEPDGYLDAEAGHGLFVAGLVRRMAPGARLLFLKALNSDGMGTEQGVARAIRYAVARGADVINLSLGFYTLEDATPGGVARAVADARAAGRAVISAAGNDGIPDKTYPAALDGVTAVGASDRDGGERADFSNHGPWVNVYAPGHWVQSTYVVGREDHRLTRDEDAESFGRGPFPDTAVWSGTSFACGIVSGHLAASLVPGEGSAAEQADALVAELPRFDGSPAARLDPAFAF